MFFKEASKKEHENENGPQTIVVIDFDSRNLTRRSEIFYLVAISLSIVLERFEKNIVETKTLYES